MNHELRIMDLSNLTIKKTQEGLLNKKFSAVELVKEYFKKIKKGKNFNAFLNLNETGALAEAKNVDIKITKSEKLGLPSGIPIAVKDNILVKDIVCTSGSKILENYVAPYDATVIKKLKEAGAIILGKTNMDEFAMGSSTENSAFGPTKNPRDLKRVPGGSSGGSAAAVAADLCVAALGSDTGGSVRQPASFCGVVGFKPTYGAVSRYGLAAMASSLDQIGPIAKTVEDAEIIFNAIRGKDKLDSASVSDERIKIITKKFSKKKNLKDIKIGIPKEYFIRGMDSEVEKKVKEKIKELEKAGAKIKEVSLPHAEYALAAYYIIMPAEVSANLARYDGIRYGVSEKKAKNLLETYLKTRAKNFGDEPKRRIMLGTYVLSSGYYDAYYLQAQKMRTLIQDDFKKVFSEVDCLITPTCPTTAFKIGENIDDPLTMYLNDIFTVSANVAGVPAISLPCGEAHGLPVGIQVMGEWFGEEVVFKVAKEIENKF
jgi:aspartyl-tRNA(Asn)/glutamyl-tRNA(Gln) amidotransferase subunit A